MRLSPTFIFLLTSQLLLCQIQDGVDFTEADISVAVRAESKKVEGRAEYRFIVLKNVDSVFLDARKMKFHKVSLDGNPLSAEVNAENLVIRKKFRKGRQHTLSISYSCFPKEAVYFMGWDTPDLRSGQVWTQGQGKYSSHWTPSFDDMNEKVEFDLNITFDKAYEVISNGRLIGVDEIGDSKTWHFDMKKPMSSYLLAFAIGRFEKKEIQSATGIPIALYYEPKDSLKVEPTYRYTKEIFDFLEQEIGLPYPWQNYKQVPVKDFLYAGMENTGATIFSNTFVVDSTSFNDKNYVNVNAHELAHHWFGNLVTEQSGHHHWLHEGFATYYAYLAEKEIFGEDHFYWKLWETASSLANFSSEGNGEALTDSSAGSLTFYEKGAWALAMLREQVGEENFRHAIRDYLAKHAYRNVTIPDFMGEVRKVSGMGLLDFEDNWLKKSEFPMEMAKAYLVDRYPPIQSYLEIQEILQKKDIGAEELLLAKWEQLSSEQLKYRLVLDYGDQLSHQFLSRLLRREGMKVRQAMAMTIEKVHPKLKDDYETLLMDESHVTKEAALYRLWMDFPQNQNDYLDSTKGIDGLPNKNVRLLWLTLALATTSYARDNKPFIYKELNHHTNPSHHFEIRSLAFQYLQKLGAFSNEALRNLISACNHHVWHFKKSCRKLLKEFLKGVESKERLKSIYPSLNDEEQYYLDKTMGK